MKKIYCDRCGREIKKDESYGGLIFIEKKDEQEARSLIREAFDGQVDYCSNCLDEIGVYALGRAPVDIMAEEPQPEEAAEEKPGKKEEPAVPKYPVLGKVPEQEPEENEEPGKRLSKDVINRKRVVALHDEGWSNQKIADELHIKKQNVAAIISSEKKKLAQKAKEAE